MQMVVLQCLTGIFKAAPKSMNTKGQEKAEEE